MRIYLRGNTYPFRDKLRQIGCRWDPEKRQWYAESWEIAIKARAILPQRNALRLPTPATPAGKVVLTTAMAATLLGVDRDRVLRLIHEGHLPAVKLGRDWIIAERDARAMRGL
jgi:excisionase family DNA binding protein